MTGRWTGVADLVTVLERRWGRGTYLRPYAAGEPWEPVTLPVKGPTAAEFLASFEDAVSWAERFTRDSQTGAGRPRFTVERRIVRGRGLGVNEVPARIRIERFDELVALLKAADEVSALDDVLAMTRSARPDLLPWVARNPRLAAAHQPIWSKLLETVNWIAARDTSHLYVRHVDVPGVDTKFIDSHRPLLEQLLVVALPADRVDLTQAGFARRFGFRVKPTFIRFRLLGRLDLFPPALTELRLRTDELAELDLGVQTVFVVENEVSYLAFPAVPDAIAVWGEGFAVTALEGLPWLHDRQIVYWGDIDTHGFAILDRLRARFPSVHAILMDQETLLAHPGQLVAEPDPTAEPLPHLTPVERALYQDLIEDRFGQAVRLEQERVRFSRLRHALDPWMGGSRSSPSGTSPIPLKAFRGPEGGSHDGHRVDCGRSGGHAR